MINKVWKICLIFLEILFCFFAIVFILYAATNLIKPRKVIPLFHVQHFVIQSGSMSPVLYFGDIVVVQAVEGKELKENDIITYYADVNYDGKKEIITHYFDSIEKKANGEQIYRTRRAETQDLDSWTVEEDDLIGRYMFHIKGLGKMILYFKSPIGMRIFALDVIIIYVLMLVIRERDYDIDNG
jgi:signal peptidase